MDRGNGLQKKDLADSGVGAIHYGQVYTLRRLGDRNEIVRIRRELTKRLRKTKSGDIVILPSSEHEGWCAKTVACLGKRIAIGDVYTTIKQTKYVAPSFSQNGFKNRKFAT